jgi:cytochrome P450
MADYFEPASSLAVARSLGFAGIDVETLRHWFHGLSIGAANFENDPAKQAIADAASSDIDRAVMPIFDRLEREPDGSAISHMLHDGMAPGSVRPRDFLLPSIKVALLGGMQEPGHGAASVLAGLLTHPVQLAEVLADLDGLLPKAVDEGLRWVAPIGTQMRQTTATAELGGVTIPAGEPVAAVISSACRDEARFSVPDRFDIRRPENGHAAYGFGTHFCAGRWFAQRLVPALLRPLLENLSKLKLAEGKAPIFRGWEFRAPAAFQVTFDIAG